MEQGLGAGRTGRLQRMAGRGGAGMAFNEGLHHAPMRDAGRTLPSLALAGLGLFLALLALLHLLNLEAMPRHVSGFVKLHEGWLWPVALFGLAAGLFGVAGGLLALPRNRDGRLGGRLLLAASVLVVLMVVFPTDDDQLTAGPMARTLSGWVHNLSAVAATTLQGAAMLVLVDTGRSNPAWGRITGTSFLVPALAVALGFAWGLGDLSPFWVAAAVVQRLLALVMVGWLALLAWRLRNLPASAAMAEAGPRATP
jgi:hypothetical protein